MSRIGKKPIPVPKGVTVNVAADAVEVQGPKGKLRQADPARHRLRAGDGDTCTATPASDDPQLRQVPRPGAQPGRQRRRRRHRRLQEELDIVGVGYRAELKGKQVHFALGYSHPVMFDIPAGIDVAVDKQTHIIVTGVDRQLVGQVAANIARCASRTPTSRRASATPAKC